MTKKEYILAVINALPDWEMWRWIKAMVQNNQLDDHAMNMLVIIFKKAMDKITKVIEENKMVETVEFTEKFNEQKQKQAEEDAASLQQLDSLLNDL